MLRLKYSTLLLGLIFIFSCESKPKISNVPALTDKITIFEVYLKNPKALDEFSSFIHDTLRLPVEWNKFDLFGDSVVYDEAFFLGNTTFELVTLYQGDASMKEKARYNRIIFGVEDVATLSAAIKDDFQHEVPYDFNIVSGNETVSMGKQTTLDSLSAASNFYVTFWEYLKSGFSFEDRSVKASSMEVLYQKLGSKLDANPMGIIALKEVHMSMSNEVVAQWEKLLGPSIENQWLLPKGPILSFQASTATKGIDWISIQVKNLETAKKHLATKDLLLDKNGKISISRTEDFGLTVFLEE
ncbi:hypothetical protein [Fulvivirga lutimaris]|uniref:hypothetical protein n=1 Tax=Fulvivirga lutimaris TaxID=1819566 RepID=UPI0012BD53CF|nr:hypothetical protein [Fulvivirga lutimaris]MTI40247.1 hypothetical protein [Fulvivirga lutimaris]